MAESQWKGRIILFVRDQDVAINKLSFGAIFSDNGSGETIESESGLFDSALKLSTSGELPVQVWGIETAVLFPDMKDDMKAFLNTLTLSRYYGIANFAWGQWESGDLLDANGGSGVVGEPFGINNALDDLFNERGLRVILNES